MDSIATFVVLPGEILILLGEKLNPVEDKSKSQLQFLCRLRIDVYYELQAHKSGLIIVNRRKLRD